MAQDDSNTAPVEDQQDTIISVVKNKAEKLIEEYVDKDFDDKHTWTIYFLVDIKIVYIISYVYISIVNLISSTANIEATDDKHTEVEFQISSTQKGHVTNISDPVLWNCRPHSASSYYYRFLYWMLLAGLISALGGFVVTKVITLINTEIVSPERSFTRLWHIALFKTRNHIKLDENTMTGKLRIDVFNRIKWSWGNICKILNLFLILFALVAGMVFSYLSFDLHPLACLRGQDDTSIQYTKIIKEGQTMGIVKINLSDDLLRFQLVAGILITFFAASILILALCFYCCSYCILEEMEDEILKLSKKEGAP